MKFESFEQALKVCMTAENGSEEQDFALIYCMENAPPDLKEMLRERYMQFHEAKHEGGCKCGCHD